MLTPFLGAPAAETSKGPTKAARPRPSPTVSAFAAEGPPQLVVVTTASTGLFSSRCGGGGWHRRGGADLGAVKRTVEFAATAYGSERLFLGVLMTLNAAQ